MIQKNDAEDLQYYENISDENKIKYLESAIYLDYPLYETVLIKVITNKLKGKTGKEMQKILCLKID